MAAFKVERDFPVFGRLVYGAQRGQSWWRGSAMLDAFGTPFEVLVRAKTDGPSQSQTAAFRRIVTHVDELRRRATEPMARLHQEGRLLPDGVGSGSDGVWDHLIPEQIDVSDDRYYGDGRIAALLIFGSSLHAGFAPAIETADGEFVQVLSGT